MSQHTSSRRNALKTIGATTAIAMAGTALSHRINAAESVLEDKLKGKVNHSVCRWC
jgi:hydroxypyruvate isomerase